MSKLFYQTFLSTNNKDQNLRKIISRVAILATSSMVIIGSVDAMAGARGVIGENALIMYDNHPNHQRDNRNVPIIAPNIQNNRGVLVQQIMAKDFIVLNNRMLALNHRLGMLNDDAIHVLMLL